VDVSVSRLQFDSVTLSDLRAGVNSLFNSHVLFVVLAATVPLLGLLSDVLADVPL
jgi:hypothetical protein